MRGLGGRKLYDLVQPKLGEGNNKPILYEQILVSDIIYINAYAYR